MLVYSFGLLCNCLKVDLIGVRATFVLGQTKRHREQRAHDTMLCLTHGCVEKEKRYSRMVKTTRRC